MRPRNRHAAHQRRCNLINQAIAAKADNLLKGVAPNISIHLQMM